MSADYAIALHTSSPDLGLAASNFAEDDRSTVWNLGRDLSNSLHVYLNDFRKPQTWQDFAFIAVAVGPGGFTGTRIGVVAARTLAQQLKIPLFGISSLAAIVEQSNLFGTIAITMPAQRGELYAGIYQRSPDLIVLQPDAVMIPQVWQQTLEQTVIDHRIQAESAQGKYVVSVLYLAFQQWKKGQRPDWSETLPFYGQHPVETNA